MIQFINYNGDWFCNMCLYKTRSTQAFRAFCKCFYGKGCCRLFDFSFKGSYFGLENIAQIQIESGKIMIFLGDESES